MTPEDYVVTYRLEFEEGPGSSMEIVEFFRGPKEECERIGRLSGPGAVDNKRKLKVCKVIVGPAKDWDQFLNEWDDT